MPEGDTLFRTAKTLRRALAGRAVREFASAVDELGDVDLVGREVNDVTARGKNLLIHFDDARVLYTHLRMNGSWHIYRPGEAWRKPREWARVTLSNDEWVAVCFSAPVVELLREEELDRHRILARLGPDLLAERFDLAEARRRLRRLDDRPLGEALMVQSAVAGIGNVYKSEVLFACGTNPFRPLREFGDAELGEILRTARRLLLRNLKGYPRVTRDDHRGERHWVYRQSGRPCSRCGTTIRMRRQGDAGRSTYWCPSCQG